MHKRQRLKDPAAFARLRYDGETYRHPLMVISFVPNDLTYNRYGFITTKRLGNAVTRNRVRRLLRESMRQVILKPGYDVAVIARGRIVGQPYRVVFHSLCDTLRRAALLVDEGE